MAIITNRAPVMAMAQAIETVMSQVLGFMILIRAQKPQGRA
jgi:hypothetical protein